MKAIFLFLLTFQIANAQSTNILEKIKSCIHDKISDELKNCKFDQSFNAAAHTIRQECSSNSLTIQMGEMQKDPDILNLSPSEKFAEIVKLSDQISNLNTDAIIQDLLEQSFTNCGYEGAISYENNSLEIGKSSVQIGGSSDQEEGSL